jgi:hypothetical protein
MALAPINLKPETSLKPWKICLAVLATIWNVRALRSPRWRASACTAVALLESGVDLSTIASDWIACGGESGLMRAYWLAFNASGEIRCSPCPVLGV